MIPHSLHNLVLRLVGQKNAESSSVVVANNCPRSVLASVAVTSRMANCLVLSRWRDVRLWPLEYEYGFGEYPCCSLDFPYEHSQISWTAQLSTLLTILNAGTPLTRHKLGHLLLILNPAFIIVHVFVSVFILVSSRSPLVPPYARPCGCRCRQVLGYHYCLADWARKHWDCPLSKPLLRSKQLQTQTNPYFSLRLPSSCHAPNWHERHRI